jgi:hypothetical protein
MLFFTQFCPDAVRTLAALQHDAVESQFEDADTDGEDHPPDGIRYGCMSRPRTIRLEQKKPSGPVPGTFDWLINQGKAQPAALGGYRME